MTPALKAIVVNGFTNAGPTCSTITLSCVQPRVAGPCARSFGGGSGGEGHRHEVGLAAPNGPDDASHLVRERDGGAVVPSRLGDLQRPGAEAIGMSAALAAEECGASAVDEQGTEVAVAPLGDAAEATAVAAYSTRARPNASVATPVRWEELTPELRPDTFTVTNIGARLQQLKEDPWQEFFTLKQRLTKKMTDAFGPS